MFRTNCIYRSVRFTTVAWYFALSLVMRAASKCDSSIKNHSITSCDQNSGIRSGVLTVFTLPFVFVVGSTPLVLVISKTLDSRKHCLSRATRAPLLNADHVGVTNLRWRTCRVLLK